MALVTNNLITQHLRGKLGDLVFRKRGMNTYVSLCPKKNKNQIATGKQETIRSKFARSSAYAREIINDPAKMKPYKAAERPGRSIRKLAFNDAFHPPEVLGIHADKYNGKIGNQIVVWARDNFKVVSVKVAIFNANGRFIEQGDAEGCCDGITWKYAAKKINTLYLGSEIRAIAFDLAGNEGRLEVCV